MIYSYRGLILDFDQKMERAYMKTTDLHQKIDLAKLPVARGASLRLTHGGAQC